MLLLFTVLLTPHILSLFYIVGYTVFSSGCDSFLSSSKTLERCSIFSRISAVLYLRFFNCHFLLCEAHKSTDITASYLFQTLEVWVHSQQIGVTHKVSVFCLESLLLVLTTHYSTSTLYSLGIFHDMCTRMDSHLFMPDPSYDWSHSKIFFLVVKN